MKHRIDFELQSDLDQEALRALLGERIADVEWRGRESEYMGVYTLAKFENSTVVKIFQPNGKTKFEVEIAAPDDVTDQWLESTKAKIVEAFGG